MGCYRSPHICLDRVRVLRALNPDIRLYGLYGGTRADARRFHGCFTLLDDLYLSPIEESAYWKWRNGDLLLHDWYRRRGHALDFQHLAILQWDLLITTPLRTTFSDLREGEVFLSSTRPVSKIAGPWYWIAHETERATFEQFCRYCRESLGYAGEPWACDFVVACLSRLFWERWMTVSSPEIGFVEYKLPTYARIFGIPLATRPELNTTPWCDREDPSILDWRVPLSTRRQPVPARAVRWHLAHTSSRVFHPFVRKCPTGIVPDTLLV